MKSQAALVWADGAVHLDAKAAVDSYFTLVVYPGHSKNDRSLRLDHAFQNTMPDVLGMPAYRRLDGFKYLLNRLQKNRLMFTGSSDLVQYFLDLTQHRKTAS